MTNPEVPAFSRLLTVHEVPPAGLDVTIEANEKERSELAKSLRLPEILTLVGRFRIMPTAAGLDVTGKVDARVIQTCTVTLEPFEAEISEPVDVSFAHEVDADVLDEDEDGPAISVDLGRDPPDPIVDGRIDLGVLASEFMVLGLDPHPRKPGVVFDYEAKGDSASVTPFAALAALKKPSDKDGEKP